MPVRALQRARSPPLEGLERVRTDQWTDLPRRPCGRQPTGPGPGPAREWRRGSGQSYDAFCGLECIWRRSIGWTNIHVDPRSLSTRAQGGEWCCVFAYLPAEALLHQNQGLLSPYRSEGIPAAPEGGGGPAPQRRRTGPAHAGAAAPARPSRATRAPPPGPAQQRPRDNSRAASGLPFLERRARPPPSPAGAALGGRQGPDGRGPRHDELPIRISVQHGMPGRSTGRPGRHAEGTP
eukprot:scaffold695_cov384-Prasinococcus_capsulatus_cf.AAC.16